MSRNPASRLRHRAFRPVCLESLEGRALLATLLPGNAVTATASAPITGVGTANVATAITNFETAIGGADNGAAATPAAGGFRVINWDAVKLDGTDFGGGANTTVISQGNTVGIPQNRFQTRGVFFETVYAVSGNGFATVNPGAAGLFPAFSPNNTFAMFNDNTIDFSFVSAGATGSSPVPAASRGFGAVFINSQIADASSIEYFRGDQSLGKFSVPTGAQGQPEFLGVLFDKPVVTRVEITLGNTTLFNFNGATFSAGGANDATHNLVVTDDFVYAEPQAQADLPAVVAGPQGTSAATAKVTTNVGAAFTGPVATFHTTSATDTAKNFFAVINWGDGHITNGAVTANGQGGFDVTGTNTYTTAGAQPITVTVSDFSENTLDLANTAVVNKQTSTVTLTASPNPSRIGQAVTFTATVTGAGTSPGTVTFLDGTATIGTASLSSGTATFTTSSLSTGNHAITATYNGDASAQSSTSTAVMQVVTPDVTSRVTIAITRVRRVGRRVLERITITNTGGDAITGPLLIVFDNLTAGTTLVNASGTTKTIAPIGSPYRTVSPGANNGLAAGARQIVDVAFLQRRGRPNFSVRVLSGVTTA